MRVGNEGLIGEVVNGVEVGHFPHPSFKPGVYLLAVDAEHLLSIVAESWSRRSGGSTLRSACRDGGGVGMASARRIGAPDAKNRGVLLDAAEQLLLEDGYAAVTSRRVADRAGLKPQLVHYYFRTMEDLFLEVFRRRANEGAERQARALASDHPVRALWEFNVDPRGTALTMEFIALANHRKVIRAEIARYAEQFRMQQIEALATVLGRD